MAALEEFIGDDTCEQHGTDDGEFHVLVPSGQHDHIAQRLHERRSDEHSINRAHSAPQTATAQHRGGDSVEFIKVPAVGWLSNIDIEHKKHATEAGQA